MVPHRHKEGYRKGDLSYPKHLVLYIEWENRDINVVERANTKKFSKLNNIMTPLILLKFFSEDVLGDMIVGYTKLYNHRGKPILMFEVTNEKVRFFLSMLLCSG